MQAHRGGPRPSVEDVDVSHLDPADLVEPVGRRRSPKWSRLVVEISPSLLAGVMQRARERREPVGRLVARSLRAALESDPLGS